MKRFYVYTLSDSDTPFYVGKGSGKRVDAHEIEEEKRLALRAAPTGGAKQGGE